MMRGGLFILSGPSGVGKGTLRAELFAQMPNLAFSISCTTRHPREGEVDGVDYRFISEEQFSDLVANDAFLEWAQVHRHRYGTLKSDVEQLRQQGRDVILEIDVQGASQVRQRVKDAKAIFVAPPTMEDLEHRLRGRGTESESDIECRLHNAQMEMAQKDKFDLVVINRTVDEAVAELVRFMKEA